MIALLTPLGDRTKPHPTNTVRGSADRRSVGKLFERWGGTDVGAIVIWLESALIHPAYCL